MCLILNGFLGKKEISISHPSNWLEAFLHYIMGSPKHLNKSMLDVIWHKVQKLNRNVLDMKWCLGRKRRFQSLIHVSGQKLFFNGIFFFFTANEKHEFRTTWALQLCLATHYTTMMDHHNKLLLKTKPVYKILHHVQVVDKKKRDHKPKP